MSGQDTNLNYRSCAVDSDEESTRSDLSSEASFEKMAGPNYAEFARSLKKGNCNYYEAPKTTIDLADTPPPDEYFKLTGKSKFATERKEVNNLFLVDSVNRDREAFPQPTSFRLKTPRPYKNITSIQVTQIKLLGSFYYFRQAKNNTVLPMVERDREDINTFLGFKLTEAVKIREGTYTINELITELQAWMNYTPLFYDFPDGGFNQFISLFPTTGDLGVNFNEPGDTYYDRSTNRFVVNPTKDSIVSYYWRQRYAGLSTYNNNQIVVAYYYPVLYEILLDVTPEMENLKENLKLNGVEPPRIVYNSQGLDDSLVLQIINLNLEILDQYRLLHTFRYYLVNKYIMNYEANTLRVNIYSNSLNTSLINLFNLTRQKSIASALQSINLGSNSYIIASNTLARANVIYLDMYRYIQSQFVKYFAVNYGTYTSEFFLNRNNIVLVRDGLQATGVLSNYTVDSVRLNPISSSISQFPDSPGYWPRINSTNTSVVGVNSGGIDPSGINISSSMLPYSVLGSNFLYGTKVIDLDTGSFYINTSKSTRSVDCLVDIKPARYSVFKFRSPARQTLQVETLPLPYYYRYADYNKAGRFKGVLDPSNNNVPQLYFDLSYAFVYSNAGPLQNNLMDQDSSTYSSFKMNYTYGQNYQTSFISTPTFEFNPLKSTYAQFEFTTPFPPGYSNGTIAYETVLTFQAASNLISTTFTDTVLGFVYHDRAAFMADILNQSNENSNHYIASNIAFSNDGEIKFQFSTFANHKYYAILRTADTAFPNMFFKPLVYQEASSFVTINTSYSGFSPFNDPFAASNLDRYPFVTNYNSNFLRLPIGSTLQGIDPSNPIYRIGITTTSKSIGYDISGVSNDLTDYRGYTLGKAGFIPTSRNRVDPFSKYTFQSNTPFNSNEGTYFPPGGANRLLTPISNVPYVARGVSTSQIKILHWYDEFSIPRQLKDGFTTSNNLTSNITSSIGSYLAGTFPVGPNGVIFGQGINAIGFLPTDGIYEISSFSFKSALIPKVGLEASSEDPNTNIAYVGVYTGGYLANQTNVPISSAVAVLRYLNSVTYTPSTIFESPGFGLEFGTYYNFGLDPTFVTAENILIRGYTQNSNDLVSYDSMYYFVPFNAQGSNITFSRLTGSMVPYPLYTVPEVRTTYLGRTANNAPGAPSQPVYIVPSTITYASSNFGPQTGYSIYQSQYEQSQPITTTSFGYIDYGLLVRNPNALFTFDLAFSTGNGVLADSNIGITTAFTEYDNKLYIVNSLANMSSISNAPVTYTGALIASSLNTVIGITGGTVSSFHYLLNPPSTVNNYDIIGFSNIFSTFNFQPMSGANSNLTSRTISFDSTVQDVVLWMWGGGGATACNASTTVGNYLPYGGAGAYAKVQINVSSLAEQYGTRTLHLVVGKGGNLDNPTLTSNVGQITGYEEIRYGGGGTSLLSNAGSFSNAIALQGGGFTGIFLDSNLATATPLVIVGGGGAAGASTLGGPGGFGPSYTPFSQTYRFSNAVFTYSNASTIQFTGIEDIDGLTYDVGQGFSNLVDSNLATAMSPSSAPFLTPSNYNPTALTYRYNLFFGSNVSSISKMRFYGAFSDGVAPGRWPTGFTIYNNQNKNQVLFSNSNISLSNYLLDDNNVLPGYSQYYYEIPSVPEISNATLNTNGWVVTGRAASQGNGSNQILQYSLDGSNWCRTNIVGGTFANPESKAIKYANGKWLAVGAGTPVNYDATAGISWTVDATATGSMSGVATSATGKYQLVGGAGSGSLYLSADYGATRSVVAAVGTGPWTGAAVAARGRYMTVCKNGGTIWTSSDYGTTWTSQVTAGTQAWSSVAVSADGRYQLASVRDTAAPSLSFLYRSADYGATWSASAAPSGLWSSTAVSGSGRYQVATQFNEKIYLSSDFGLTWDHVPDVVLSISTWTACANSTSGQYILAAQGTTTMQLSSDYGVSWTPITLAQAVSSVTMSATGKYMTAAAPSGNLWTSYDFGVTWTQITVAGQTNWASVTMSGDGRYQFATNTNALYVSVAAALTHTNPYVMKSSDGITWTPVTVAEYSGTEVFSLEYSSALGLWIAGGSGGGSGSLLWSEDGEIWSYSGITNAFTSGDVKSIRLLNSTLWALSSGLTNGKTSTDGLTWSDVPGIKVENDIAYGASVYVAVGTPAAPYFSPILHSDDGVTWSGANPLGIDPTFVGNGVAFGGGLFIVVGTVGALGSVIYLSFNGTVWSSNVYQGLSLNRVIYENSRFTAVGLANTGAGAPQTSILNSSNGISWSFSLTGGYDPQFAVGGTSNQGYSIGYGPLSVVPNLSSIYVEFIKTTPSSILGYEFQAYGRASTIGGTTFSTTISSLIDRNFSTFYWPSDTLTPGLTDYPFLFTMSNTTNNINRVSVYCPDDAQRLFSSIELGRNVYDGPLFSDSNITFNSISGFKVYTATLIPSVSSISQLYMTFHKHTPLSLQMYEVVPSYDENYQATQVRPYDITDLSSLPTATGFEVSKVIDNSLQTYWYPTVGAPPFTFTLFPTFVPNAARISRIQVFSSDFLNSSNLIEGVGVFTDPTRSVILYSNILAPYRRYLNTYVFDLPILPVENVDSLYIELYKSTPGSPMVREIRFYNVGLSNYTAGGYAGGFLNTMTKSITNGATPQAGGGAGTLLQPGYGGAQVVGGGYSFAGRGGSYLKGGSPAPAAGNQSSVVNFVNIRAGAGGGGGGYYGGGGGGTYGSGTPTTNSLTTIKNTGSQLITLDDSIYPTYPDGIGLPVSGNGLLLGTYVVDYSRAGGVLTLTLNQPADSNVTAVSYSYVSPTYASDTYTGAAGGGGSGFILSTSIISILEYGTASLGSGTTPQNYLVPGQAVQDILIGSNLITPLSTNTYYGYGGQPSTSLGTGGHGLILMNWLGLATVTPSNVQTAIPSYIDGSRLNTFETTITYDTFERNLEFKPLNDPIENTSFAGKNFVWLRSYLSLVGQRVTSNLTISSLNLTYPPPRYPTMPNLVYNIVSLQFSNVSTFFTTMDTSLVTPIATAMDLGQQIFQTFFVNTPYTASNYVEYTELYGTLEYLRVASNLQYPHINSTNSAIDRIFGGVPDYGYWPNPFLVNASYIGFDIGPSLFAPSPLASLAGSSNPVRAAYGFIVEQSLSTGKYRMLDVMAYKPTQADVVSNGSNWAKVSQFPESIVIREAESQFLASNISIEPFNFKNAIEGKIPLFRYSVYTAPIQTSAGVRAAPIHVLNDFEGAETYLYTYQNSNLQNVSSIHLTKYNNPSTLFTLNQTNITQSSNTSGNIIGNAVTELRFSTINNAVTKFGFGTTATTDYIPVLNFNVGVGNQYNDYARGTAIGISTVGKAIFDYNLNLYSSDNSNTPTLYQNICTFKVYNSNFNKESLNFASPKVVLSNYQSGQKNPYFDYFTSKFTNIWHVQGTSNLSTLYGARLTSPFDFTITTNFVNQAFYPTIKTTITRKQTDATPITDQFDLSNYPYYPRTQMFLYSNWDSLLRDVSGNFAMEKSSNFSYMDSNNGYNFFSYIDNAKLDKSTGSLGNSNSYNYLAIRGYSPSETFKCLLRFYLPNRYDFGYMTLLDISNEVQIVQTDSNVNPTFKDVLTQFNSAFIFNRTFGSVGVPGFSGSNISSISFGNFLNSYMKIYNVITANTLPVSTVNTQIQRDLQSLIVGDLRNILPSNVFFRDRVEDPLEFKILFSTVMPENNRTIDEYGLGYNLGYAKRDTAFDTIQRAGSFFKILDDYIFLKMNPEYNMNRLDISRRENYAQTKDSTAESQLYNCKLLLNNFGQFAQTIVQNPVNFNPPIGRLDTLSFQWYDITGTLIDNNDCEWSATIQVVERVDVQGVDSSIPRSV